MNIDDLQSYVVTTLEAYSPLSTAAIPVISEDGTYPATEGLERGLADKGIAIVVWQIESDGIVDVNRSGLSSQSVMVPVVIEENRKVNSTGISAEKAMRYVMQALAGKPSCDPPEEPFTLADPPFKNFWTVNGIRRFVVMHSIKIATSPS